MKPTLLTGALGLLLETLQQKEHAGEEDDEEADEAGEEEADVAAKSDARQRGTNAPSHHSKSVWPKKRMTNAAMPRKTPNGMAS